MYVTRQDCHVVILFFLFLFNRYSSYSGGALVQATRQETCDCEKNENNMSLISNAYLRFSAPVQVMEYKLWVDGAPRNKWNISSVRGTFYAALRGLHVCSGTFQGGKQYKVSVKVCSWFQLSRTRLRKNSRKLTLWGNFRLNKTQVSTRHGKLFLLSRSLEELVKLPEMSVTLWFFHLNVFLICFHTTH